MHELHLILITFFAAFVGVIPPGVVNMAIAKTCVDVSVKAGKYKAIGAACVVYVQAFIAIIIAKLIMDNPIIKQNILIIGLIVIGVLMIYFFIKARYKIVHEDLQKQKSNASFFWSGVLISAINVFPIPYFVLISTLFTPQNQVEFTWPTKILFGLSAAMGSLIVFLLYVFFFDKIIKKNKTFKTYSNYFMAALMFFLFMLTLFRIYA